MVELLRVPVGGPAARRHVDAPGGEPVPPGPVEPSTPRPTRGGTRRPAVVRPAALPAREARGGSGRRGGRRRGARRGSTTRPRRRRGRAPRRARGIHLGSPRLLGPQLGQRGRAWLAPGSAPRRRPASARPGPAARRSPAVRAPPTSAAPAHATWPGSTPARPRPPGGPGRPARSRNRPASAAAGPTRAGAGADGSPSGRRTQIPLKGFILNLFRPIRAARRVGPNPPPPRIRRGVSPIRPNSTTRSHRGPPHGGIASPTPVDQNDRARIHSDSDP